MLAAFICALLLLMLVHSRGKEKEQKQSLVYLNKPRKLQRALFALRHSFPFRIVPRFTPAVLFFLSTLTRSDLKQQQQQQKELLLFHKAVAQTHARSKGKRQMRLVFSFHLLLALQLHRLTLRLYTQLRRCCRGRLLLGAYARHEPARVRP